MPVVVLLCAEVYRQDVSLQRTLRVGCLHSAREVNSQVPEKHRRAYVIIHWNVILNTRTHTHTQCSLAPRC